MFQNMNTSFSTKISKCKKQVSRIRSSNCVALGEEHQSNKFQYKLYLLWYIELMVLIPCLKDFQISAKQKLFHTVVQNQQPSTFTQRSEKSTKNHNFLWNF